MASSVEPKVPVTVRLPPQMVNRLQAESLRKGIYVSELILMRLDRDFEREDRETRKCNP